MRQIKFRGKAHYIDEWRYGNLLLVEDNYHIVEDEDMCEDGHHIVQSSDRPTWITEKTIGQFSGLHDKNGKEIYEGDIVDVVSLDTSTFGEKKRAVIVYDEELCCFDFKGADRQRCMCVSIPDVEIMVIGNIWDNHELIPYKDEQQ